MCIYMYINIYLHICIFTYIYLQTYTGLLRWNNGDTYTGSWVDNQVNETRTRDRKKTRNKIQTERE